MPVRDLLSAASTQGGGPADPYFNYVPLLLNGDGTNGSQNNTFLDSSTNNFTITRNGNTTQGSFSPYGNLWSNYFNGSNAYLTAPDSTNWNIGGSSTYSVETWVCVTASGVQTALTGALNRWWLGYNFTDVGATANKFSFSVFNGSSWQTISSSTTPAIGTWYNLVATFDNGTTKLYVNGTQEATTTGVSTNSSSGSLFMGAVLNPSYTYGFTGYLSNIRITKGGALPYTSNFTPSTTPLTAISNTVILTAQSNRFIDNSSNNYTITVNGTPSVQRFSPFNPTAPYDTSVIGGSGYFSGSGDYLSLGTNPFSFSGGTYTLEAWVYITAYASTRNCVFIQSSTSLGSVWFPVLSITSTALNTITLDGNTYLNFTGTVPLNTWTHVAVSKSGTSVRAFINGTQLGSAQTDSSSYTNGSQTFLIGGAGSSSSQVNGYIEDLRVNNTTALYTTNFIPPTAPETAVSGTQLLLNYVNAGIPDLAMQNNLQTVGSAQVSTSVKKYGTGSLSFNGSGDWLSIPNTPNLQLGSGNFTIEGWINFSSLASNRGIMYFGTNPNSNFSYGLQWAGNALYFWYTTTGSNLASVSASWTPSTSVWYFLAVTRSGNDLKFFIDGTQIGTTQSLSGVTIFNSTDVILIGGEATGSPNSLPGTMNGYIDDFRVSKGLARYTTTFTPPTAALPTY